MRTLKKTLALVLVLAMMFSLCAVSASADFTDADEITYVEAAEVLAAIGVIEGMPDGSFDAKGTLTRAQAATMIVRLLDAEDVATAAVASFDDVAADHWAAAAIAYCAEEGIIDGYGDGNFGPSDTLTGYAWAKMLLVALGSETEYTGAAWQIAVAKDAAEYELFTGNEKADKTAAATREEAALYALNALIYSPTSAPYWTVTVGTAVYKFDNQNDALLYSDMLNGAVAGPFRSYEDTMLEDVHYVTRDTTATDAFGRPAVSYDKASWTVPMVFTDEPVATITGRTAGKDVFAATGAKGVKDTTNKYVTMTVVEDGAAKGVINYTNNDATAAGYFGEGITVEIYATSPLTPNNFTLVAIRDYFGVVTGVTPANPVTGDDAYVTVTFNNVFSGYETKCTATFDTDAYAIGDAVIATIANGEIATLAKAEMISGTITKVDTGKCIGNEDDVYTIGDKTYQLSELSNNGKGAAPTVALKTVGYWYVDSYGNIIANASVNTASTDYLYVNAADLTVETAFSAQAPTMKIKAMLADGTYDVYELALTKKADGWYNGVTKFCDLTPSDEESTIEGNYASYPIWGYTVDEDGKLVLEAVKGGNIAFTAKDVRFDLVSNLANNVTSATSANAKTVVFNDNTKYVVLNTTTGAVTVYTAAERSSLATLSSAWVVYNATSASAGAAEVVFAVQASTTVAAPNAAVAYVDTKAVVETIGANNATVYNYTGVLVDGTTIALTSTANLDADKNGTESGLYKYDTTNKITGAASDAQYKNGSAVIEGGMLKVGSAYYGYSNAKIVNLTATGVGLSAVDARTVYVVLNVVNNTVTTEAAYIYIVG